MKLLEYKQMALLEDRYWWFLAKRMYVTRMLHSHLPKKPISILDLGSGTGGMTAFLSSFGKVKGIEKNTLAVKLASSRKLDIMEGDINNLKLKSNSFDLVTLFDVLYHQKINEKKVLVGTHKILKKNGLLLITDSARPELWSEHDRAMHAKKRFVREELNELLIANGFKIIRSSYIFFFTYPVVYIVRKLSTSQKKSAIMPLPHYLNWTLTLISRLESWLFSFTNFPIGSSVIVLAQKK